jgi:hypothetical protein
LRLKVTSDCASHRVNPDYKTLLVEFDGSENNLRPYGLEANWQPTDDEVLMIVEGLADLSPTFREKLFKLMYMIDFSNTKTPPKPRRKVRKLAEMLL